MEKEKLKQKQKYSHKKNFLRRYCGCMFKSNEIIEAISESYLAPKPQPQFKALANEKVENQLATECSRPEPTLETLVPKPPLQQKLVEQICPEKYSIINMNFDTMNRAEKDQLVKNILSKYSEVKKTEISKLSLVQTPKEKQIHATCLCPEINNQENEINVEYFSNDDLTVVLEPPVAPKTPKAQKELPKSKADFPTKTKSAPTTSVTRDSLADICYKLYQFKLSDSIVARKRKLELVFDQPRSDEISSSHEDSSTISLQYKISCERTGTQRPGSVLLEQKGREISGVSSRSRDGKVTSRQELRLEASPKSQISEQNESTSSLKWKLIISHHKDFN